MKTSTMKKEKKKHHAQKFKRTEQRQTNFTREKNNT